MERTRVITAKITIVEKNAKEEAIADALKKKLKADDVQVSNVKDFILTPNEK